MSFNKFLGLDLLKVLGYNFQGSLKMFNTKLNRSLLLKHRLERYIGEKMEKLDLLYEGKAKKVYTTNDPDVLIVDYKDDATAFNGEKKGTIVGKGVINNRMTNHVFKILESKGVPTHLVEELSDRETAVKKVDIVPLEVIIRNVAAGSFSKRLGVPEGTELKTTA